MNLVWSPRKNLVQEKKSMPNLKINGIPSDQCTLSRIIWIFCRSFVSYQPLSNPVHFLTVSNKHCVSFTHIRKIFTLNIVTWKIAPSSEKDKSKDKKYAAGYFLTHKHCKPEDYFDQHFGVLRQKHPTRGPLF